MPRARNRARRPLGSAEGTDLGIVRCRELLGFLTPRGLTGPNEGNPAEVPLGALPGWARPGQGNPGALGVPRVKLHALGVTVLANVWGDTEVEYRAVVERIGDDPGVCGRLVRDLALWCERHGVSRVAELSGTLKTWPRPEKAYV